MSHTHNNIYINNTTGKSVHVFLVINDILTLYDLKIGRWKQFFPMEGPRVQQMRLIFVLFFHM